MMDGAGAATVTSPTVQHCSQDREKAGLGWTLSSSVGPGSPKAFPFQEALGTEGHMGLLQSTAQNQHGLPDATLS